MRTRGRPAPAEANIVVGSFGKRPDPPETLTPRQAEIWREVVASEDPKFFDTGALRGLLADYCRHRESSDQLNDALTAFKPTWLRNANQMRRYQALLRMRGLEIHGATVIATKLRLTNQARYVPHTAARAAAKVAKIKPWEV